MQGVGQKVSAAPQRGSTSVPSRWLRLICIMLAVTALAVLFQQIDHNVHGLVGRFAALQAQPQEVHTQQAIAPLQRFFRKHRLVADRHAVFVDALLVAERPPDL